MAGPKARLSYGTARGVTINGVQIFRGIPYAAPPVGDARWRPPAPPIPWSGERILDHFGASAMQGSLGAMGEMIGIAATP
ncbi:MAG TPA: carboxylesterase family protein, partial [Pseudomonadales bacterium]